MELILGKGSYSTVYLKQEGPLKKAIKKISIPPKKYILPEITQQISILNLCCHPNIISFSRGYFQSKKIYCLQTDYIAGECLDAKLIQKDYEVLYSWIFQISLGLLHLHNKGIIHRDIKGSNIMVTSDNLIKIIDFGVSIYKCQIQEFQNRPAGSPCYMAPEIIKKIFDEKVDVWSLGVTIYELVYKKMPFKGGNKKEYYQNALKQEPSFSEKCPGQLIHLMKKMLIKEAKQRISIEEILNHPSIQIRHPNLEKKKFA